MTEPVDRGGSMSKVRSAGIMASGSGSRLIADGIHTPKPFLLVSGRPLISYFLDDACLAGITQMVVTVRPDDTDVPRLLSQDSRFSWEFVETQGAGTLEAVSALTARLDSEDHVISTCDVVLPPGSIAGLLEAAKRFQDQDPAVVLMGTDLVHDTSPIWLHVDPARPHVLTGLGKEEQPSPYVFGNVRWGRRGLADLMQDVVAEDLGRDTRFMGRLVRQYPGSVLLHLQQDVLDVDDRRDLEFAQSLVTSSPRYQA